MTHPLRTPAVTNEIYKFLSQIRNQIYSYNFHPAPIKSIFNLELSFIKRGSIILDFQVPIQPEYQGPILLNPTPSHPGTRLLKIQIDEHHVRELYQYDHRTNTNHLAISTSYPHNLDPDQAQAVVQQIIALETI